jgi:hypothetical protein
VGSSLRITRPDNHYAPPLGCISANESCGRQHGLLSRFTAVRLLLVCAAILMEDTGGEAKTPSDLRTALLVLSNDLAQIQVSTYVRSVRFRHPRECGPKTKGMFAFIPTHLPSATFSGNSGSDLRWPQAKQAPASPDGWVATPIRGLVGSSSKSSSSENSSS